MLRHVLTTQGVPPSLANTLTTHSLRLWAAEMAYQAKVPRDLRRYVGHWAKEEEADT